MFHHFIWIIELTIHQYMISNFSVLECEKKKKKPRSVCVRKTKVFSLYWRRERKAGKVPPVWRTVLSCLTQADSKALFTEEPVGFCQQGELGGANSALAGHWGWGQGPHPPSTHTPHYHPPHTHSAAADEITKHILHSLPQKC